MNEKSKRPPKARLWPLYALERGFYWLGWLIFAATAFNLLRMLGEYNAAVGDMSFQRIGLMLFGIVVLTVLNLIVGGVPAMFFFAMSRLLRWGLRLKEENLAQAEMIQRLLQEREDWSMADHLMEKEQDIERRIPERVAESVRKGSF